MLRYVGERYMRYAATGEVFLEAGPNSPENLLACEDFDGTQDLGGVVSNFLHSFAPHDADFARLGGGPTWGPDRGTGILGAISYLAEQELTSMYVLLLSREGDGDDVWPWSMPFDPLRFDCSKLDQWARVFDHATERGIHLQLVLTETENESYFEFQDGTGTTFADSRKLYYREMVARFGQTLALTWNLGEENGWSDGSGPRAGNTDSQRRAFSAWLANLDPYDHPIIVHTYHGPATGQDQDGVNMPLTAPANPALEIDGASLQGPYIPSQSVLAPSNDLLRNNHAKALYWIQRSQAAGHPWVVAHHEQMPAILGTSDDSDSADPNHDTIRKDMLWGTLMAGGGGVQYYFGYKYRLGTGGSQSGDDLTAEDFRPRADLWRQSRIALRFFREHVPVERLDCIDALVGDPLAYCMAAPGDFYCVYFRSVSTPVLNLGSFPHSYEVLWFDPYAGGVLQQGTVAHVAGPGQQSLGMPPGNAGNDWVALVRRVDEVPGSGCPGAAYVQATGPARLGASLGLTLPPPAFPQTSPLLLLGVPPTAPVFLPAALTCGGSAACRFDIDVLQSVAAASLPGIPIPNDPGLLGAELAVAGAYASAPPVCVDLTGALLLPFVR